MGPIVREWEPHQMPDLDRPRPYELIVPIPAILPPPWLASSLQTVWPASSPYYRFSKDSSCVDAGHLLPYHLAPCPRYRRRVPGRSKCGPTIACG